MPNPPKHFQLEELWPQQRFACQSPTSGRSCVLSPLFHLVNISREGLLTDMETRQLKLGAPIHCRQGFWQSRLCNHSTVSCPHIEAPHAHIQLDGGVLEGAGLVVGALVFPVDCYDGLQLPDCSDRPNIFDGASSPVE